MIPDEDVDRILAVAAHPDDIDFAAAGTIALWCAAGIEVAYCVVTDGQAGGVDPSRSPAERARLRRREQRAAAARVGVEQVQFLGYEDGRVRATLALRRDLARVIREVRPDRALIPSPERNWSSMYASHPDHLATGEAAMAAVYPDSRNRFAFPELAGEGLSPYVVREVWLVGGPAADHAVDVSAVLEQRLAAVACHNSQIRDPDEVRRAVTRWLADNAEQAGLGGDRYAEVFRVVDTDER